MIKRIFSGLLFLVVVNFAANSQEFDVVPKQKSLEAGFRFIPHSSLELKSLGWNLQGDVSWQVSGFNQKRASYISVPLGFGQFVGGGADTASQASLLQYGWTIRHELSKDKKIIPFINYSLLLNQLWIKGTTGHSIGHETRFDFGLDIHSGMNKMVYLVKLEYSHLTFPSFGSEDSDRIEIFSLKTGIRF